MGAVYRADSMDCKVTLYDYIKAQDPEYFQFLKIKEDTNGYLVPSLYHNIYISAFRAPEGYLVDIGPAQGGSSISLCLGLRDSKKKASKVISIEKGSGSAALKSNSDVETNRSILQDNINSYGLADYSIILMGDVLDVSAQVPTDQEISLIFIDADGALDRDFSLFFNRMTENAPVIIDDYIDIINSFALNRYLKWDTLEQVSDYVKTKGANRFIDLCPLGKEHTTFRLLNYMIDTRLVVLDKVINNTFFGYKVPGALFTQEHKTEFFKIRKSILAEYLELNPLMKAQLSAHDEIF